MNYISYIYMLQTFHIIFTLIYIYMYLYFYIYPLDYLDLYELYVYIIYILQIVYDTYTNCNEYMSDLKYLSNII